MKNKTLVQGKKILINSKQQESGKKTTYKKTFLSMRARVWGKETYRKKEYVLPVIPPLFVVVVAPAIFKISKLNSLPKP